MKGKTSIAASCAVLLGCANAWTLPVETAIPELVRLQGALQQYRQIADNGGWPRVPAGPTIEPGSTDPRVAALAARLRASRDLTSEDIRTNSELSTMVKIPSPLKQVK